METIRGNMVIAQSGGPTMVINQSLVGILQEAKKHHHIDKIFGSLHGIKGILEENFVDLRLESDENLEKIAKTPSSALGSVRMKPTKDDCGKIFEILKKHDVRYFYYIGGNDSAETVYIINEEAQSVGYDLRSFHIPKTIDNDLRENDHTPGFGSAAKFVASALMGDNLDNRALGGVKIDVIMGRHAGFLTGAAALARVFPGDGPHLIYLPEVPFSTEQFVKDVQEVVDAHGRCVVAVSEGIADENGKPIVAKLLNETDSHGNVQLSGTGALGDILVAELKEKTDIARVRADTFGYLQRSFVGCVSENDVIEARQVGVEAVKASLIAESGSIAIRRVDSDEYKIEYELVPLKNVAKDTKHMAAEFIAENGHDVTPKFIEYLKPIVGDLPEVGKLVGI
ncbi:MAG: 6-phosphofructokinase [Kiritimatiellae bacterium]|jgi:6-phosphofructokinase|nr:6-phosphofructokinase [Kiritimatiellia bacterium]